MAALAPPASPIDLDKSASLPPVVVEPQSSGCCRTAHRIAEFALRILSVAGMVGLLTLVLPASINLVVGAVAATVGFLAILFFEITRTEAPQQVTLPPAAPLSEVVAPAGIRNAGNDCWLNSITQLVRINPTMGKWFKEVPAHLDEHVVWLDSFSSDLIRALPDPLPAELLAGLNLGRLDLHVEANNKYAQRLLAMQPDAQRVKANEYARRLRAMRPEERENLIVYLDFLRAKENPMPIAHALSHFKFFLHCYRANLTVPGQQVMRRARQARGEVGPQEYFNVDLRVALSRVDPQIRGEGVQQDAATGVRVIQALLPSRLQVQLEEWKHYNTAGKPLLQNDPARPEVRVIDGRIKAAQLDAPSPIPLPLKGDAPNIQDMLQRILVNRNPERSQISVGTTTYDLEKIEQKFMQAPATLWLLANRARTLKSPWVGLHRMMPNWFDAKLPQEIKPELLIEAQKIIEVPTEQGVVQYKLTGFIRHRGQDNSAHYISYICQKDVDNQDVWFELDDSKVTRLTDQRMREICSQSVIYHYSKVEPGNG